MVVRLERNLLRSEVGIATGLRLPPSIVVAFTGEMVAGLRPLRFWVPALFDCGHCHVMTRLPLCDRQRGFPHVRLRVEKIELEREGGHWLHKMLVNGQFKYRYIDKDSPALHQVASQPLQSCRRLKFAAPEYRAFTVGRLPGSSRQPLQ